MTGNKPMLGKPQHPPQVGYQVFREDGIDGTMGLYYNYVLAGNGLYIEAGSPLLSGRVQVVDCKVRGLPDLEPELHLAHGIISSAFLERIADLVLETPDVERYLCITLEGGDYYLKIPSQHGSAGSVEYERLDNVVMDIHSHTGRAFFSSQDTRDEKGLRLYGVIGNYQGVLQVKVRLGVYGYYGALEWQKVFDGDLPYLFDQTAEDNRVLIPGYDPANPAEKYPGGILPGNYELVKLLRENADNPEAVGFIADMLEE